MRIGTERAYLQLGILGREHPDSKDTDDANWLIARIEAKTEIFEGSYITYLRSEDFTVFMQGIEAVQAKSITTLCFTTMEEGVNIQGTLDFYGHISWQIECTPTDNTLFRFALESDYESLTHLWKEVNEITKEYPTI